MSLSVKLKKGLDIRIKGAAEKILAAEIQSAFYGVKPVDFPGLIPKLNVKPGDKVSAGTPLFHDKISSGNYVHITGQRKSAYPLNRGDRRKLLEIIVEKNGNEFIDFGKSDPPVLSREKIKESFTYFRFVACCKATAISYCCKSS